MMYTVYVQLTFNISIRNPTLSTGDYFVFLKKEKKCLERLTFSFQ